MARSNPTATASTTASLAELDSVCGDSSSNGGRAPFRQTWHGGYGRQQVAQRGGEGRCGAHRAVTKDPWWLRSSRAHRGGRGSPAAVEEEDDACGDSGAPPLRSKRVGDVGEGAGATGHAQTARGGRRPRLWRGLGDGVVVPSPNPRRGRGEKWMRTPGRVGWCKWRRGSRRRGGACLIPSPRRRRRGGSGGDGVCSDSGRGTVRGGRRPGRGSGLASWSGPAQVGVVKGGGVALSLSPFSFSFSFYFFIFSSFCIFLLANNDFAKIMPLAKTISKN